MPQKPPTRAMRENPDLDQLKSQAKELLQAYRAFSPDALAEVAAYHRDATTETFALHDAQFVLARSYGFESWPKLRAAVDGVTAGKLHEAAENGDLNTARDLLTRRPEIVDLGRGEMRALHMAVLRRDLEMIRLLVEHGAKLDVKDKQGRTPMTFAEGVFLAVQPPVRKPSTIALLQQLLGKG